MVSGIDNNQLSITIILNYCHGGEMMNFEIKDGGLIIVLGNHKDIQEALSKFNNFLANGWYKTDFLEGSRVILIEGSYITQRREYPVKITGSGIDRITTII